MQYTIQDLAGIAGVSTRTLRYYDQIGLLTPAGTTAAGYRMYGAREVDILQMIRFYRELDMPLKTIKAMIQTPSFDFCEALRAHRRGLAKERDRLNRLIKTVDQSIAMQEGNSMMQDKEKFEGFKKAKIEENEARYGKEIREKYGDDVVDASNKRFAGMSEESYARTQAIEQEMKHTLLAAFHTKDPGGPLAQKACALHKAWLSAYWQSYSLEAHRNLGDMYVQDARFTAYYDKDTPGLAAFLRDALYLFQRE